MAAEWYVGYMRADAFIIEVELEDIGDSNTANTVYDDVVFVASVGTDGEVAGSTYAVEG